MSDISRSEFEASLKRISQLEQDHEVYKNILVENNRNISDELSEIKQILVGDGTDDHPGIVGTFKWIKTLKVYAKASWVVLVFLIGLIWGLFEAVTYIKEHWLTKLH